MAIYHLCIKIISRGKGKSAVAASAYRSGEKIKNEYDGEVHDFTRKGGNIKRYLTKRFLSDCHPRVWQLGVRTTSSVA